MKKYLLVPAVALLFVYCTKKNDEPSTDNKSYKIAYNVLYNSDEDDYEIFVMDLDGSNKKNISNSKGVDWVYYTYGNKIYFISDRDTTHRMYFLYEMDADGNNVRKISDIRLRDSWLSSRYDAGQLIINPHPSIDSVFYIIDKNGDILEKVNTGLAFSNDPCFSPDGRQIVFRGGLYKSKRDSGFVDELYIINTDGTGLKKLTNYPLEDTTAEWFAYKAGPPRWNSPENFITYQSKQNGKYSLYAVLPDGSRQWKLTDLSIEEGWHDWSSDSKWLAIETFDSAQTTFNIALMNWQTKDVKVITDTTYKYQQAPVFVEVN